MSEIALVLHFINNFLKQNFVGCKKKCTFAV